jgi:hypothetical protein
MYLTFVTPIAGVSACKVNIPTPETCKVIKLTIEMLTAVPKNTALFFNVGASNLNIQQTHCPKIIYNCEIKIILYYHMA